MDENFEEKDNFSLYELGKAVGYMECEAWLYNDEIDKVVKAVAERGCLHYQDLARLLGYGVPVYFAKNHPITYEQVQLIRTHQRVSPIKLFECLIDIYETHKKNRQHEREQERKQDD